MSCSGCSNAVNKALNKLEGVDKVDISLADQTVVVETSRTHDEIFEAIKNTGKAVTPAS
ncbi:11776_t:CDS:2 [Paraglomus brasilianum]|uniref:11776_t:CDS:1 n=1 Tax=Paraglomus brasilianum TaxID=144538 RepID=A0A9N9GWB6_9GLOM|nr:11776_t:CDS:2 [Paraglomus brasilianum]